MDIVHVIAAISLLFLLHLEKENNIFVFASMLFLTLFYISLLALSESTFDTMFAILCVIYNVAICLTHYIIQAKKIED